MKLTSSDLKWPRALYIYLLCPQRILPIIATDTFTTIMQPYPSQPHLSMETHLLIPATLFATWVAPSTQRLPSLYHRHILHGLQYRVPPFSFRATNTAHTKPRVLAHTKKMVYTKPRARFFAQGALNALNHVSTFNQSPVTLLHKGSS